MQVVSHSTQIEKKRQSADESQDTLESVASEDDSDDVDDDPVVMEGYLQKKSLHLKKFRKRFIVLQNNHLYCDKNEKCKIKGET